MKIFIKGQHRKTAHFIGFTQKFQGLGFMISTDNPYVGTDYITIELKLFWFKAWLIKYNQ